MALNDQPLRDEYIKQFGNAYIAVNYVATESRRRRKAVPELSTARSLSWVLSGKFPDDITVNARPKPVDNNAVVCVIEDTLSHVSDDKIQRAVRKSIQDSIKEDHLLYECLDVLDASQQARVRVLVNIIWYNLSTLEWR